MTPVKPVLHLVHVPSPPTHTLTSIPKDGFAVACLNCYQLLTSLTVHVHNVFVLGVTRSQTQDIWVYVFLTVQEQASHGNVMEAVIPDPRLLTDLHRIPLRTE